MNTIMYHERIMSFSVLKLLIIYYMKGYKTNTQKAKVTVLKVREGEGHE